MAVPLPIDMGYVTDILYRLLTTPSPTGHTTDVVRLCCAELGGWAFPMS